MDPLSPPADGEPDAFLAARSAERTAPAVPPRVLVVDDDARMLESVRALLQHKAYDVVVALGGSAALEALQRTPFDLVLLDLQMPDVSGHDVMDYMLLNGCTARVIVTSGASDIEAAIGALQRGAFGYLRKPYPREELIKTVENALAQRLLEAENQRIAQRLKRSEHMFRHLVDSSPDIIFTLDVQGHITFINDRVQNLLGYPRAQLIGRHYGSLVHDADRERAHYIFSEGRKAFGPSRSVELRLKTLHADAEARSFNIALRTMQVEPGENAGEPLDVAGLRMGTYCVARDITERKRADEQIAYQAYHDILTELPNRSLFKDRLGLALLQAKRNEAGLAVMCIDLDRFKAVNDTLGHGAGDALLQQVAFRLRSCLRRGDTLSRSGGDEFSALLPQLANNQDAARIAQKFVQSLHAPFQVAGHPVHVSASVGVALYPADGLNQEELVRNADVAMYHMKSKGKNGYAFFESTLLVDSYQKIALEHDLHLALERNELEMFYQPQTDIVTQRIIGAEALMRWNHPQRGFLGAGEFLPFAEESGLILPISDWMLEAICRDFLEWSAMGDEGLRLSLNMSPQYLDRGDFFDKLKDALQRHGIPPGQIEVEVTENICIRNPQTAIDQLDKLCQLGVSVAIDDFGTGYSSLSYLHRFPIDTLKIDRSFVMEITDASVQYPVVLAIVAIAQGLGLHLVAEGVETEVQAQYLADAGCRIMQGYLYHQPMSHAAFLEVLGHQTAPMLLA